MAAKTTVSPDISTRIPVSIGQRVVPAGGHRDLADRLGEEIRGNHARLVGQGGQRRVVLDRHRGQRELRAAAVQQHPGALDADIHRLGRGAPW